MSPQATAANSRAVSGAASARRRGLAAILVLSLALFSAVADTTPPPWRAYNIILLVLDTTRADHFGLYGYARDTTPFIDQLADEGMVWSHFTSSGTHTIPSTSSLLTGVSAATHRATRVTAALDRSLFTLPQLLRPYGYETRLITSNEVLVKSARQIQDRFDVTEQTQRPDENLFNDLIGFLREEHPRPFFVHAQPLACHSPYLVPEPFNTLFVGDAYYGGLGDIPRVLPDPFCYGGAHAHAVIGDSLSLDWYVSQYDGLLAYMDRQIEGLLAVMEEQGLRENTLLVITADHGEMLGDHGYYLCHRTEYEANTHVPLLLVLPRRYEREFGSRAGSWDDRNVNQIDLAPTILSVLGIDPPPQFEGHDLLAAQQAVGLTTAHSLEARAIWDDSLKLIHHGFYPYPDPAPELFAFQTDPGEINNLASANPDLVRKLQRPLLSEMAARRFLNRREPPAGVFYQRDFSGSRVITDWATQQICGEEQCHWSIADDPWNRDNPVLLGVAEAWPPEPSPQPISLLGFIAEPEEPYGLSLRLLLGRGEVQIATSATYTTERNSVTPAWGYAVRISASEMRLVRLRPGQGLVELDRAAYTLDLYRWHTLALTNAAGVLRLLVDGEPVLRGSSGPAAAFFHGTTYLGLFNQTTAFFDDVVQWRGTLEEVGSRPAE